MIDQAAYKSWIKTLTAERIEEEIADLEQEKRGNEEMSESAHYHRDEGSNMFLADWEDYEHEAEKCQICIDICKNVLKEK